MQSEVQNAAGISVQLSVYSSLNLSHIYCHASEIGLKFSLEMLDSGDDWDYMIIIIAP